jgi:hypothetical protein
VEEISDLGALVRTGARLLPGTHVDVHLITADGRVLQRAKVARASVWAIDAPGVVYQVALAFDSPVDSSGKRVGATQVSSAQRSDGERLPTPPRAGLDITGLSPPGESTHVLDLALDLEGAGCTFAKESPDVHH